KLSDKRAKAVADYLKKKGVLKVTSKGQGPTASFPGGLQQNRRATIKPPPPKPPPPKPTMSEQEAYDLGFEDGTMEQQYGRRRIEKMDAPEVTRLLPPYERGVRDGAAAKKRAYDDGFADGKAGDDNRPRRDKIDQNPKLGPNPLLDDYDQGFRDGSAEYDRDHPEPGFDLPWFP